MEKIPRQRIKEKHRLFAKYFIMYDVGTTAVKKAGYKMKNPYVQASLLLKNPVVQQLIEEERQKNLKVFNLEAEEVMNQYKSLAFADINNYFELIYRLHYVEGSKTHERLLKYVGYTIDRETFLTLSIQHQKLYVEEKKLKDLSTLTKSERAAIAGITYDKFGNPIIKLSDKEKSLESLSKILGLYEKDNNQRNMNIVVENRSLGDFYKTDEDVQINTPLNIKKY